MGLAFRISEQDAKAIERWSQSWTGIQDGQIVGCGGFTPLWDGVADIWMYLAPDAFKRKKLALKLMKHILNDIMNKKKYHRIQAVVLKDFKQGIRFAEFFGFKNEGLMKQYSMDKEDFYRFARIVE
jgi:RimJ/RimL family protein N-acetyltransferase